MAVIQLPNDESLPQHLPCVICHRQISPAEAVVGLGVDGNLRFACNGHFWNPHQLIAGWADFLAVER